jgi:uncharacterized membrane protein
MVLAVAGPRRVPREASAPRENVGRAERWISVLAGSALTVYGLDRRDTPGALAALLGAALIHRGATARCPVYSTLGVSSAGHPGAEEPAHEPTSRAAVFRASDAVKVERSIAIARPPEELYALWKDPSNLPRFMDWLERVEQIDARHARWTAKGPAGANITWVAEVINDVPNSLIAWKSVEDADIRNAGSVHFRRTEDGLGTEVRLVFEWLPPGGRAGMIVARLLGGAPDRRIEEGLAKLKELAEGR